MKIDIFTHISPAKYNKALFKLCSPNPSVQEPSHLARTPLSDLDLRIKQMDKFEEMIQVITLVQPPIEHVADFKKAADLASIANDEMAELVARYPGRFLAVAALPMNNIDAALKEIDRAINDLNFRGVQIYSSINGKALDSPEFLPLYEKMSQHDLPIWIHPFKDMTEPDYPGEHGSKYNLTAIIGLPHATSMAMLRLAASGVLERYPNLKFITHHAGGTVPYLAKRIETYPFDNFSTTIIDSLRLFFNDTAVYGNTPNLMCAYAFCSADHLLFGTDSPAATPNIVKQTINSIEEMNITSDEKKMIFEGNAKRLMKLSL